MNGLSIIPITPNETRRADTKGQRTASLTFTIYNGIDINSKEKQWALHRPGPRQNFDGKPRTEPGRKIVGDRPAITAAAGIITLDMDTTKT